MTRFSLAADIQPTVDESAAEREGEQLAQTFEEQIGGLSPGVNGGGGGVGGIGGARGGRRGGGGGGTGGLLSSLSGGAAAGGLATVALGGAVAFGMLQGIQTLSKASPALQATTGILSDAMSLFFRPFGRFLSSILRPAALGLLNMAVKFNEIAEEEGLAVAIGKIGQQALTSLAGALGNAVEDIVTGEGGLGDVALLGGTALTAGTLLGIFPSLSVSGVLGALTGTGALLSVGPVLAAIFGTGAALLGVTALLDHVFPKVGVPSVLDIFPQVDEQLIVGSMFPVLGAGFIVDEMLPVINTETVVTSVFPTIGAGFLVGEIFDTVSSSQLIDKILNGDSGTGTGTDENSSGPGPGPNPTGDRNTLGDQTPGVDPSEVPSQGSRQQFRAQQELRQTVEELRRVIESLASNGGDEVDLSPSELTRDRRELDPF